MNLPKRHLIASCLLAGAITTGVLAMSASATAPRKITNCNKTTSRPKLLTLTCGDGNTVLKGLSWSSFGGATAQAKGTFVTNTCKPNCAEGKDLSYPVSVKASASKRCKGGVSVYKEVALTFPGRKPGSSIPRNWKLGCPI
jgi:hypothetical protein